MLEGPFMLIPFMPFMPMPFENEGVVGGGEFIISVVFERKRVAKAKCLQREGYFGCCRVVQGLRILNE